MDMDIALEYGVLVIQVLVWYCKCLFDSYLLGTRGGRDVVVLSSNQLLRHIKIVTQVSNLSETASNFCRKRRSLSKMAAGPKTTAGTILFQRICKQPHPSASHCTKIMLVSTLTKPLC